MVKLRMNSNLEYNILTACKILMMKLSQRHSLQPMWKPAINFRVTVTMLT